MVSAECCFGSPISCAKNAIHKDVCIKIVTFSKARSTDENNGVLSRYEVERPARCALFKKCNPSVFAPRPRPGLAS